MKVFELRNLQALAKQPSETFSDVEKFIMISVKSFVYNYIKKFIKKRLSLCFKITVYFQIKVFPRKEISAFDKIFDFNLFQLFNQLF